MYTETMTYKDYNGELQTQDFYFHLTKADVIELEVEAEGNSLSDMVNQIVREKDGKKIVALFKDVIGRSYGIKTVDGRFVRSAAITERFFSTEAYSDLVVKIYGDPDFAASFINSVIGDISKIKDANGKTASQIAREKSEELLRGRQQPAQAVVDRAKSQAFTDEELALLEEASQEETPEPIVTRSTQTAPMDPEAIKQYLKDNPEFFQGE